MDIHIHFSADDNLIDTLVTGIIAWGKATEWQYKAEKIRDRRERDKAGHLAEWSTNWASAAPEAEAQQASLRKVQPQDPLSPTPPKENVETTKPEVKVEEKKEAPKKEELPPSFGPPLSKEEGAKIDELLGIQRGKEQEQVSEEELPSIRAKLTEYITANEADGKVRVRAWLHAHGADRVSHLKRADVPAFLQFLEAKEEQKNA